MAKFQSYKNLMIEGVVHMHTHADTRTHKYTDITALHYTNNVDSKKDSCEEATPIMTKPENEIL